MLRREFSGAVVKTLLAADANSSTTTITLVDGSTFPTGSSNPFVVVIDRTGINEEKVLVGSRSTNTLTVLQRGYDGTIAQSHLSGIEVDHVLDASTLQDMNNTTYDNEINIWMAV